MRFISIFLTGLLVVLMMGCSVDLADEELPQSSIEDIEEADYWTGARVSALTISNIYDMRSSEDGFYSGDGFSLFIETPKMTMLFDTPYKDLTRAGGKTGVDMNMELLNIDPTDIDSIVLSHEHGSRNIEKFLDSNNEMMIYGLEDINIQDTVESYGSTYITVDRFKRLIPGIYTTGAILGDYDGSVIFEQVLVIAVKEGLVVFTGCSHPGIEVILEKVSEYFSNEPIYLLYGGLHLRRIPQEELVSYTTLFEKYHVKSVALTHCTGNLFADILRDEIDIDVIEVGAGSVIDIHE